MSIRCIVVTVAFTLTFMNLLSAMALADDAGIIKGRVVAKRTAEPLLFANIVVKGTDMGAPSITDGQYIITGVPAGRYWIVASYIGYQPAEKEVEVHAGDTTTVDFELEEDVIQLEQIVVTATRIPTYIKDVPIRTEIVTGKAIEEKGAVNVYEALEGLQGVRVEQQCSYCNFSTVRIQGLGPDHVQILIDGQPSYSGLAGVYGLQQMPTANIEQIEVVKGAGSALYGSSAIAGVINIITKKPTKKPALKLTSSFGSHSTNSYTLAASANSRNTDVLLTAQKSTGDEIDENGDGFTDRVKTDNTAIGVRVIWHELSGSDELSLTGGSLNEARQGGELTTWENPFAEAAEHIKTTRYEARAGYRKSFLWSGEIAASVSYVQHHRNATNDVFLINYMETHGDSVPPVNLMQPYLADEHSYVVDLQYSHPLFEGQLLLGGLQYSYDKLGETGHYVIVDEEDANTGGTYASEGEKHAHDIGIYLQDEISIRDKLDLVFGARYDIHHSEDDFGGSGKVAPKENLVLEHDEEAFSPRMALRYKLSSLSLRVSVGTGFRVPYGFSEDLHLCSGSPRVNKPADLKPEKSISLNVGVDYRGERYLANANFFRTNLKNKIDFIDASEASKKMGYTYEWANIDNAYTQGIELGAGAHLTRDLVLEFDLAYTDAQYENERDDWVESHPEYAADSRYIPRVPELAGGVQLSYSSGDWNLILDADYTGRMYIDYCKDEDIAQPESKIKHTEPFWVVNWRGAKTLSEVGLTAFMGVKNLFDYTQEERHSDDAAFMYAPYTGRIVYGGFEINF